MAPAIAAYTQKAPALQSLARSGLRSAVVAGGPLLVRRSAEHLARRGLTVNHTQGVTLGVIAAYVVAIALLWNIPYVRNVLWPFKMLGECYLLRAATATDFGTVS